MTLHYGQAAGQIREAIDLFHASAVAADRHPDCFASVGKYGIDPSTSQAALEIFARALQAADDPTVKARVEKASIVAYRSAIEPAWKAKDLSALSASEAEHLKPLVCEFFRLCETYGVRYVTMHDSLDTARARFTPWLKDE